MDRGLININKLIIPDDDTRGYRPTTPRTLQKRIERLQDIMKIVKRNKDNLLNGTLDLLIDMQYKETS